MKYLIPLLCLTLATTSLAAQPPCKLTKVTTVGGCDAQGLCGAKLANGTLVQLKYPVVGQPVCVAPTPIPSPSPKR